MFGLLLQPDDRQFIEQLNEVRNQGAAQADLLLAYELSTLKGQVSWLQLTA